MNSFGRPLFSLSHLTCLLSLFESISPSNISPLNILGFICDRVSHSLDFADCIPLESFIMFFGLHISIIWINPVDLTTESWLKLVVARIFQGGVMLFHQETYDV